MGWIYTLVPKLFLHNLLIPWSGKRPNTYYCTQKERCSLYQPIDLESVNVRIAEVYQLLILMTGVSVTADCPRQL